MFNLSLQKLHEWVWPWPWTFKLKSQSSKFFIIKYGHRDGKNLAALR